jgi:hypothetical protein
MYNKKTISGIVAIALLLVVSVLAVVGFQGWFNTYYSSVLNDVEVRSSNSVDGSINIEKVIGNTLYVKNNAVDNLSINDIKISNITCNISQDLSLGINEINIEYCINMTTRSTTDVVLVTNQGVYVKEVFLKKTNSDKVSQETGEVTCLSVDDINLVGLWHFDNNLEDSSVNSNEGSGNNGVTFNSLDSISGSSVSFDGVDDYISISDDSSLEFDSTDFTISMWVKSNQTHVGTLISKGSGSEDSNTEYMYTVSNRFFMNNDFQEDVIAPNELGKITINGRNFNGNVITVGNDGLYTYNYTDPATAFDEAPDGSLILIYPGTYTISDSSLSPTKGNSLYVKGMGSEVNDVTLYRSDSYHTMKLSRENFTFVVENMKIQTAYSWGGAFVHRECNSNTTSFLNKLNLVATSSGYVVYFGDTLGSTSDYDGNAYLTNINIDRGYATLREVGAGSSTSIISVEKARYHDSYACTSCSRNPFPHDYVTSTTTGYGYNYGDYLINFNQIPKNTWTHMALTYNDSSSELKYFIDGNMVKNITVSGSYTTNLGGDLYFGSRGSSSDRFEGLIDDLAIYKRKLSDSEISNIASSSSVICD